MKRYFLPCVIGAMFFSTSAFANVKLVNRDSKSHDILIKCSSSTDSSIGDSSTRDLGNGWNGRPMTRRDYAGDCTARSARSLWPNAWPLKRGREPGS